MYRSFCQIFFSFLCLAVLALGTAFFCLKSPTEKKEEYQQIAIYFIDRAGNDNIPKTAALYLLDQAEIYAVNADRLHPLVTHHNNLKDQIAQKRQMLQSPTDTAFLPQKQLIP